MDATEIHQRHIPHSLPTLGVLEAETARRVLESKFVGYGPVAVELERRLRESTGLPFAFAVSSGFHALSLAVRALDLKPDSLIAVPVLTCASVLAAVLNAGHRVWLADISERDLTIDPRSVAPGTDALIVPRAYGAPLDTGAIRQLGLPWIEDCATSPAPSGGECPGRAGEMAVFSFASTKYVTGGSGGAVVALNRSFADRITDLLECDRPATRINWNHVPPPAFPGRLADINAAVALTQYEQLHSFSLRRRAIASRYMDRVRKCPGLHLPEMSAGHIFYRFIVRTEISAETLAAALRAQEIDARTSVNPWLHEWVDKDGKVAGGPWPAAEGWREHLLSLPIYPGMSDEDVDRVAEAVGRATEKNIACSGKVNHI
jgi:dTDP-4-amino-4,6-dideoxygalactose transaminase